MNFKYLDDTHLINCIKLRIYDYSSYIKLLEKNEDNRLFYIKKFIKEIRKYPITTDGLISALIYAEKEISFLEFQLEKSITQ